MIFFAFILEDHRKWQHKKIQISKTEFMITDKVIC